MNVEIGTDATQFPEKEYINGIFLVVCLLLTWQYMYQRKSALQHLKVKGLGLLLFFLSSAIFRS